MKRYYRETILPLALPIIAVFALIGCAAVSQGTPIGSIPTPKEIQLHIITGAEPYTTDSGFQVSFSSSIVVDGIMLWDASAVKLPRVVHYRTTVINTEKFILSGNDTCECRISTLTT